MHTSRGLNRRSFLGGVAASLALLPCRAAFSDIRPEPPPRATSGDNRREPAWDEKLSISVGAGGDVEGSTEKAIQAAVDYCARLGGGTVRILPGTYIFRNSVFLKSGIRMLGSGADTIFQKAPMVKSGIAVDSDWFDQEITLTDAGGFDVGDGVCLTTTNADNGGLDVFRRTLVARGGNRFKLDQGLRHNFWTGQEPVVATLFPLLTAEYESDITIEDVVLDGNRTHNDNLNGNYGGGVWFQDCSALTFRNVESHHYNGDGFSWQICHDVIVERCYSHDNADLGLHPGSGSQRPVMRDNRIENNTIGIFFCWGVREGIAENNTIVGNRGEGVSIGHRDHHNVVRGNRIEGSGRVGILFRPERGTGFTATGNLIEGNTIRNSGGDEGIGVDIQGVTAGNRIEGNRIDDTRGPAQRVGIRIGSDAGDNVIADNTITNLATSVLDLRTA
jgi:hypothetical protein